MKRFALVALGGALLMLGACQQSPESRIQAACTKNGLMGDGSSQPQQSPAEVKRVCECFTRNVKQSMTPAELKMLADRMNSSKEEERKMDAMPPEIATKAMGAVKACAIS